MRNIAFRFPFFFGLCVALGFAVLLVVRAGVNSTSKGDALHDLIDSSPKKIRKEQKKQTRELTQQRRSLVSKQIYIAEGKLRRLFEIAAERSEIRVVEKRPHMHVVETFYDAKGNMQHELFYTLPDGTEVIYDETGNLSRRDKKPTNAPIEPHLVQPKQRFRYFEAKTAIYDFHTNQLLAYGVQFWTFTANGHDPVKDPFTLQPESQGIASRMTLFTSDSPNKNHFSAEHIKIQFTPERGL